MNDRLVGIFFAGFLLLQVFLMGHTVRQLVRMQIQRGWPTVSARVTEATVRGEMTSKAYKHYFAHIEYDYMVRGQALHGASDENFYRHPDDAEAHVKEHPAGRVIDVHVDPHHPDRTKYRPPRPNWSMVVPMSLGIIIPLLLILAVRRGWWPRPLPLHRLFGREG